MPDAWAAAAEVVTRDLAHLYEGPKGAVGVAAIDDVDWQWDQLGDGYITVGTRGSGAFTFGVAHRLDAETAEATVRLADAVQTDLAGYEYTLWPVYERFGTAVRTLAPELRDGTAVWVTRDGEVYAEIGSLAPTTSSP